MCRDLVVQQSRVDPRSCQAMMMDNSLALKNSVATVAEDRQVHPCHPCLVEVRRAHREHRLRDPLDRQDPSYQDRALAFLVQGRSLQVLHLDHLDPWVPFHPALEDHRVGDPYRTSEDLANLRTRRHLAEWDPDCWASSAGQEALRIQVPSEAYERCLV